MFRVLVHTARSMGIKMKRSNSLDQHQSEFIGTKESVCTPMGRIVIFVCLLFSQPVANP